MHAANRAGGKPAFAAGLVFGRALQHQDRDTLLGRRECCAKRRIAGADDDDIHGGGERSTHDYFSTLVQDIEFICTLLKPGAASLLAPATMLRSGAREMIFSVG